MSSSNSSIGGGSLTRSSIGRSRPVTSRIAAAIRPRKWPSTQSRVKSFGTARTKRSSASSSPRASPKQVPYVVSLSAPLSRPATSPHRLSAVSSISCSTCRPVLFRLAKRRERRAYQPAKTLQMASLCRCLPEVHGPSTAVESGGGNSPFRLHCEELACGQVGGRFLSILAARRSPEKGRFPPHEAHLPAQRSPPQAQARLSDAHVLPRGPADPQATPRQGPRAPLRVAPPKLRCSGEA